MNTPSQLRAALRARPDEVLWPSARVLADLGAGRLELEAAVFSPDDLAWLAVGDRVEVVGPTFKAPAAAAISAMDGRTVTLAPPVTARAGDYFNLVELAPEA